MLIIFDLDDTLIDTSGCITTIKLEDALHQMVGSGLTVPDFACALEQLKRMNTAAESARHAVAEFLEIQGADSKYLEIATKEIYENFSHDLPLFPFDSVIEILKVLSEFHNLALVTAGTESYQQWKLKKTGIDSALFSKIVVCDPGTKKIHYLQVMEELGFSSNDVVVCGDRVSMDLAPAKELGLRTIHIRKGRGRKAPLLSEDIDHTIHEFHEILDVISLFGKYDNK